MAEKDREWEHLGLILGLARDDCINLKREPPFTACCVSLDGGVLVLRLSEGSGDPEILVSDGSVMGKPMTIVVVDRHNMPTLFTLSPKGPLRLRWPASDRK
jgi:hypothetical protein